MCYIGKSWNLLGVRIVLGAGFAGFEAPLRPIHGAGLSARRADLRTLLKILSRQEQDKVRAE
jgi:hypothetical protein